MGTKSLRDLPKATQDLGLGVLTPELLTTVYAASYGASLRLPVSCPSLTPDCEGLDERD